MSLKRVWAWFWAWAFGVSVRVKIMGIALGLVLLLGFAVTLHKSVSHTDTRPVLLATLFVSLVGLFAAYGLTWVLTRPLLELRKAARRVAAGEFGARARVWSRDEIGQLTIAFNAMTESLQQMQAELQRKEAMRLQLLDKLMAAQEEERKRVARELHDETSQSLTSLMVGLKVLETVPTLKAARVQIGELRALTARTLEEVHRLALELRPSVLDDWGLVAALQRYVDDFAAKARLDVDYQTIGLDAQRLPPPVEIALYRFVQEALTNVTRHAHAQHVSVVLKRQRTEILAIIEDNGVGFDVAKVMGAPTLADRLGLFGMQERAALLGGTLTIESSPTAGTTLFITLPLEGVAASSLGS